MNFEFQAKRISGILTVVPENERTFLEEMAQFNFPERRSLKLKETMGYDRHRLVQPGVCVSDLAVHGLGHLFDHGVLDRDDCDALILVTQSPDHFLPPTSSIIQGRLGLKQDMFCLDVNQGCAGFLIGLMQAFLLLEQAAIRKVVLINADVLSRKTSPQDRNSYPLVGDAAAITVVEAAPDAGTIHANLKMDGTRNEVLMIPAGGFRRPADAATAEVRDAGDGNVRADEHLRMDGSAVFNFVQVEVPPLIRELLATADVELDDVDRFFCHQPNRFMLNKLADALGVPHEKMPANVVEHYGNSSGVTIPVAITHNLADGLRTGDYRVCLAGFGVGLTWSAMLMSLGRLDFCEMIEYPDRETNDA